MLKKILLLTIIICIQNAYTQTVSTVTEGNFHDGLAVDSQGNIYGSDFPPVPTFPNPVKNVYKYDTNGNVTVFATGFVSPNGIGVNSQDEIYICDHYGNAIKKYDLNGTLLANYNTGQFSTPSGVKAIPNTLDMLVVEYSNTTGRKIKRLAADGTVTTLYSGSPLSGPAGIAYVGDVPYIANFNNRKILRFLNGTLTEVAQLPSSGNSQTDFLGFLTSANGLLYATHYGLNAIYTIDPTTGVVSLFAGSSQGAQDGNIATATFNGPNGIVADPNSGKIYVSDAGIQGPIKNLRIIENAFLAVDDVEADTFKIQVFTNPVKNSLNVKLKLKTTDPVIIQIIDLTGKLIYTNKTVPDNSNFTLEIPVSQLEKGTYFFKFLQNDNTVSKKIII